MHDGTASGLMALGAAIGLLACAPCAFPQQPPPAATSPAPLAIDAARLDAYAGYYQLGPRAAIRVHREESRFFLSPVGGSQRMELVAQTPERFAVGSAPVTIGFRPAADGSVSEAIVTQGGREIVAPRITEQAATALVAQAQRPPPPTARTWASAIAPHRELTRLTGSEVDYWPSFTPDGTTVIFSRTSDAGRSWAIHRVPVAGGAVQPLFARDGIAATRASVARDGRIVFNAGDGIWTMDRDGGGARAVPLKDVVAPVYAAWLPDGQHIVFVDGARNILYRADLATGTATPVTRQSEVLAGMPAVSPDGREVAFAGQRNAGQLYNQNDNQIWLVDDAGNARPVESTPMTGRTPSWSPDGKRIAFESNRGSPDARYALFVIDRDGNGLVQLTDYALNANHPAWSADGRRLVFSWGSEPGKPNGIAVIDVPVSAGKVASP